MFIWTITMGLQNFLGITLPGNVLLWHGKGAKKEFTKSSDKGQAKEPG